MFVNNQELIYYSLLHQPLGFSSNLDVKFQRLSSTKTHLSLVKLFIFIYYLNYVNNFSLAMWIGNFPGYCLPEIFVNNKISKVLSLWEISK
jgi:hypothetical protein